MRKKAIVAGSGSALWQDVAKIRPLIRTEKPLIICVNHTALYWPELFDYCVTIHAEILTPDFQNIIRPKGARTVSCRRGAEVFYSPKKPYLDSGLLATHFALEFADEVILCGIPLDNHGKFYELPEAGSNVWQDNIIGAWKENLPEMKGRVYSMSGKTKELFGQPLEVSSHGI